MKSWLFWAVVALSMVPAAAMAADEPEITTDVVYGHKDGMALTLDVYEPADANGAGILFMVSGGWVSSWRPPQQMLLLFNPLLDEGYTVFSVRHGSSPRYKVPDAYADVKEAIRFVRENAAEYDVDPQRLGVFGFSAGGHLSLMLGTTGEDPGSSGESEGEAISSRVQAVVAYFPPVDLRAIVGPNERFPALEFEPELAESVSPLLHVTSDDAPTLLLHGDKDDLVPLVASTTIHEAFQKENVPTDIIIYEGAGHGFRGEDAAKAAEATIAWFGKYLNAGEN